MTYKIATNIECSRGNQASICEKDYIKCIFVLLHKKKEVILGYKNDFGDAQYYCYITLFIITTIIIIIYCYIIKCCSFEHFIQQRILKKFIAIKYIYSRE